MIWTKPQKQLLIYAVLFILCATQILATPQFEISTDNTTWENITSFEYDGAISTTEQLARVGFLSHATKYYVRARDEGYAWTYSEFFTEGTRMISIVVFFSALSLSVFCFWMFTNSRVLQSMRAPFLLLGILFLGTTLRVTGELASWQGVPANIVHLIDYLFYVVMVIWVMIIFIVLTLYIRKILLFKDRERKEGFE